MILYWGRELAGWCLVLLGLFLLLVCFLDLLSNDPNNPPHIFFSPLVATIGIVIFRGGIHLLKVAVAARVSLRAQAEIVQQQAEKRPQKAALPWYW